MGSSVRGRAKSIVRAALALATVAAWAAGPAVPRAAAAAEAEAVETTFGEARARDDLAGVLADAADSVRITYHATAGTKLSATLTADTRDREAVGAAGLSMVLLDSGGVDQDVAGTPSDVSRGETVRWRRFPLGKTDDFVLVVRAATPGTWRLRLTAADASTRASDSTTALPPDGTDEVEFEGIARGAATWKLRPSTTRSRFRGEVVRIVQPDDTDLPDVVPGASGRAVLQQHGTHRLVYRNVGAAAGDGTALVTVRPPRAVRRVGYVEPDGTAFVPVVTKVDPSKAFHKESALAVRVLGRDFQTGADVRLVRRGRPDILGTDVVVHSETEISCLLDLDTVDTEGEASIGAWTVGVWNDPQYLVPDDRSTLVLESLTRSLRKKFNSLAASSIRLPDGVVKGAEVWFVDFNQGFQGDLEAMGLGSADAAVRGACRSAVEAYTILFLRDLYRVNETTGSLKGIGTTPICFVVARPTSVAGVAGEDYNRIEVGGAYQDGDERDEAEPLFWGFAPIDEGNATREDLSVLDPASGERVGRGARTRALDPNLPSASPAWQTAMAPLLLSPLTANDRQYFAPGFVPNSQAEADRYTVIVRQVTRASREIAAIVAHHVGKAMGLEDGVAAGPMANPTNAGNSWPATESLGFSDTEALALRSLVVPHELPGRSSTLRVTYFPLLTAQSAIMPDCITPTTYATTFKFVGGRPNAVPTDYRVQYVAGSIFPPPQLKLSFESISGTVPVSQDGNPANFTCYAAVFRIAVTDRIRGGTRFFLYRLDTYPDVSKLPQAIQPAAQQCIQSLPPKPN